MSSSLRGTALGFFFFVEVEIDAKSLFLQVGHQHPPSRPLKGARARAFSCPRCLAR